MVIKIFIKFSLALVLPYFAQATPNMPEKLRMLKGDKIYAVLHFGVHPSEKVAQPIRIVAKKLFRKAKQSIDISHCVFLGDAIFDERRGRADMQTSKLICSFALDLHCEGAVTWDLYDLDGKKGISGKIVTKKKIVKQKKLKTVLKD